MRYPRQQSQVVGLVDHIINGVTENPDIFPHCDAVSLQNARNEYSLANAALTDAKAQFNKAAVIKLEKFNRLQQEMKKQIKLGTVDNVDNPENLSLIGWGTKRPPSQIEIPAPPGSLKITAQSSGGCLTAGDNGMLCLVWDKSRYSSEKPNGHGPVRSYSIERKQFNGPHNVSLYETNHGGLHNASWSEWTLAGTTFNNEIKLTKQPIGCKLEYQVRAGNASGQSCPSNTVSVVL